MLGHRNLVVASMLYILLSIPGDPHLLGKFMECAKVYGLFFLDYAFRMLIGWARKVRSASRDKKIKRERKRRKSWEPMGVMHCGNNAEFKV